MSRLMFCTIGTGRDISSTLRISLEEFGPDRVILFTSEDARHKNLPDVFDLFFESQRSAGLQDAVKAADDCVRVCSDSGAFKGTEVEVPICPQLERINDAETLTLAYRSEILDRIESQTEHVFADFTRGTKPMSAALFYAASSLKFDRINYVSGERDGQGMVIRGTEESHRTYGRRLQAAEALRESVRLFNNAEYSAAASKTQPYLDHHESQLPFDGDGFQLVATAAEAYSAWERFGFETALEALGKLRDADHIDLQIVGENFMNAREIKDARQHIHRAMSTENDEQDYYGLAADLVENARRRIDDRAWDDALGRLYRATEYLAQIRIADRFDETTERFPTDKVPEPLITEWGVDGDHCQLGLDRGWSLLATAGDEVGELFNDLHEEDLQTALYQRNHSILAHGFEPVAPNYVDALLEAVDKIGGACTDRWHQFRSVCQFQRIELNV